MSMFGFDADLGSKIDQLLAGRPSAKQRVEEFLVDELHVDPTKIPLSLGDAQNLINQKMSERDSGQAILYGSSMGLSSVTFHKAAETAPNECPACHYHYVLHVQGHEYECEDCTHHFTWKPPSINGERITERSDANLWMELLRVYAAFRKGIRPEPVGDAPDCDECGASNAGNHEDPHLCEACEKKIKPVRPPVFSKFEATHSWNTATVTGIPDKKPKWKKPEKYPSGSTLRISDGIESQWIRVGGPFSDTDLVNLATMKPIQKVTGWTVVEVLDDE